MKTSIFKFIFITVFTVLLSVACTNETVQPNPEDGIAASISANAGGMQTRATNDVWDKNKVELQLTFRKGDIESSLDKKFDTIMEAVEYFYNFLKTI